MNCFESMVSQLQQFPANMFQLSSTVSKYEYEIFCKEFVFDQLKGVSFGEVFCKRFNINDSTLPRLSDDGAKFIIERSGYLTE